MENIALLSNARDNGFIGVNMYCDDEGTLRGLPPNRRASEIAHCCGKPLEVRAAPARLGAAHGLPHPASPLPL